MSNPSTRTPRPTGRLHVPIANKAALPLATASLGAAQRLKVRITDEAALPGTAARSGAAIGLTVMVLDEAALAPVRCGVARGNAGPAGRCSIGVLNEAALRGVAIDFGAATRLEVTCPDEAALPNAATVGGAAIGLAVRVLDEAALPDVSAGGHAGQTQGECDERADETSALTHHRLLMIVRWIDLNRVLTLPLEGDRSCGESTT